MELVDRYLQEVGKYLPRKNREDILAEIRSYLEDTLDERTGGKPAEADVIALLKESGSPQKTAASYAPEGQYVVGPGLYPLFRLITGIAIAAAIGAQLLAWGVSLWSGSGDASAAALVSGLLMSVPTTLGTIVIVFMILQRAGVQPKLDKEWDPRSLPVIKNDEMIKRGELIFGVSAGSLLLALLVVMSDKIGVYNLSDGLFYANPVIQQNLPGIYLALVACIGLDIYLLWRGRWNVASRAAELGVNLISIVVLAMLYKGHSAWLLAHGFTGAFGNLDRLATDLSSSFQMFGMECFQIAFGIALIVVVAVTISKLVKIIFRSLRAK